MTKYVLFMILSACFVLLLLPAFAAAADDHGDRVCIYKHDNFHGHEQCYRPGEQVSDLKHIDVESIRVFGHARVMLFEDRDFRGRMMEFNSDMPDLGHVAMSGSRTWQDHIGSLRVVPESASFYESEGVYDRPPHRDTYIYRSKPGPDVVDTGVCVYEKPGFEGRYQCFSAKTEISDLSFSDWKNKISSVRVFGDARLVGFRDTDFHGDRVIIDHDVSDLRDVAVSVPSWSHRTPSFGNWNDEIQSLEVRLPGE